jgi:hypothetical protein
LHDLFGRVGVADGGLVVEAEDGGEVKWVWSTGEGLVELAVHSEPFEGGRLAAEGLGEPDLADGPVVQRGALVDDQMGVRGGGPAGAPVL